jgi:hypothetical protein
LQREYARALRGEIIGDIKRGQKFERVNVVGALWNKEHFAIECYRQRTDGVFFEKRFKECLPGEIPKGYTVIMDNARFRRKKELRKLAGGKVRILFLPPYSPDYNPIEKSWANMKRFLNNNLNDFHSVDSGIYNYFGAIDI